MVSDCQKARIFQITQTQVVGGGSEVNIGHSNDNKYTPGNAVSSWGGASSPVEERFGAGSVLSRMETRIYYVARPLPTHPMPFIARAVWPPACCWWTGPPMFS